MKLLLGMVAALGLGGGVSLSSPGQPGLPAARCAGFCAGFGRADITPPPGVGLAGNGPEGKQARGYRVRLMVRALVLKDARGEAIALVVADLAHISPTLHRLTAARVAAQTGLSADRIIISATHTHAGPGHFYSEKQYNGFGSSVSGYDTALVTMLSDGFSRAILDAWEGQRPARAAWGQMPVWGFTRNRSYEAYLLNKPSVSPPFPVPSGVDPVHAAVDPTWTMLRVDLRGDGGDSTYYPAGAYSVFAIHGTANPPDGDLLDADIHGALERGLERYIDQKRGYREFRSPAIHLVANGTEGDVSPDWPATARCGIPRIQPALHPGGLRTPSAPWVWRFSDSVTVALCTHVAREFITAAGDSVSRRLIGLYDKLGNELKSDLPIAVAFRIDSLPGFHGLCPAPFTGVSTTAGAEDGPTRLRGWRLFGLFNLGFEEGGSAVNPHPRGCQREKRVAFGESLQNLITGRNALARVAQLAVVRIGPMMLGAVPAEVTTVAGYQMKRAIRDSVIAAGAAETPVVIVGLANGFIQYITSDEEYRAQNYEGGSTIYGPRSAMVLAEELGSLAGSIERRGGGSPPNLVYDLEAAPGPIVAVMPRRDAGPPPEQITRTVVSMECGRDTVTVRWLDAYPGRLVPADGKVLELATRTSQGWKAVTWDDDPAVEVRAIRPGKAPGYLWEVRWTPGSIPPPYRFTALPRVDFPVAVSAECPPIPG
ncbi:MAG: neutral/alkaline non-lysosomal ceramidase N-terminal domain-containing protein [Gemmatimonadota bacterium]